MRLVPLAAALCLLFPAAAFVVPQSVVKESPISVSPLPLPGQAAGDFELAAVVGDSIKKVRLSDFRGKWVYLNFFPAAFTFV